MDPPLGCLRDQHYAVDVLPRKSAGPTGRRRSGTRSPAVRDASAPGTAVSRPRVRRSPARSCGSPSFLEDQAVEVQGQRCGALAVGGGEPGLERRALAEGSRRSRRIEQRHAQRVRPRLRRSGAHEQPEADPVVARGEGRGLDHAPPDPERVQLATRRLHRVREEGVDLHQAAPSLARRPSIIRSSPNSNCSSKSQFARNGAHAATLGSRSGDTSGNSCASAGSPNNRPVSIIT